MAIEDLFCVLLKEENDISKVPIPNVIMRLNESHALCGTFWN